MKVDLRSWSFHASEILEASFTTSTSTRSSSCHQHLLWWCICKTIEIRNDPKRYFTFSRRCPLLCSYSSTARRVAPANGIWRRWLQEVWFSGRWSKGWGCSSAPPGWWQVASAAWRCRPPTCSSSAGLGKWPPARLCNFRTKPMLPVGHVESPVSLKLSCPLRPRWRELAGPRKWFQLPN